MFLNNQNQIQINNNNILQAIIDNLERIINSSNDIVMIQRIIDIKN